MNLTELSKEYEFNIKDIPRFPSKIKQTEFLLLAYEYMVLSRKLEEKILSLFKKGQVKGTAALSVGNEATAVALGIPFRPRKDVLSILHRSFATHLLMGMSPFEMFCQFLANEKSGTHGREGNVHHGNAKERRFPMMSHLGNMLSTVVGGVWFARKNGEDILGLGVIGDGGTSTGDFHESLNFASVRNVPVLFLIENNYYAFSTPIRDQYACEKLSDRAVGYGIEGITIDGTDAWDVYSKVVDAMEKIHENQKPYILEVMTLRLMGHAAYDTGKYVSKKEKEDWAKRDPLVKTKKEVLQKGILSQNEISALEQKVDDFVNDSAKKALQIPPPTPLSLPMEVFQKQKFSQVKPKKVENIKHGNGINLALDYLLQENAEAFLLGQDIAQYGSALGTCKGLFEKFGPDRVINTPICESSTVGFSIGASQTGGRPIVEFQFADFATEAATQLGLNAGTWYFRSDQPCPTLFRFPCGGGITLGAFHSGEFEGLWSRFPGLKLIYPFTAQEAFEALVAGYYDPNPCLVFEHKKLYWSKDGNLDFDGNLEPIWKSRQYAKGNDLTIISWGAMLEETLTSMREMKVSADLWNPFVMQPLDFEPIKASVKKTGRLLVIQESGMTAGMGDRFISLISQNCHKDLKCPPKLVSALDLPVPFATELERFYLPNSQKIQEAIEKILRHE